MSATAVTKANAHLIVRAREIVTLWETAEAAEKERIDAHYAWVDHMVEVERVRRETLPCHHGTAFWPDRGQVCGGCENESSYDAEPLSPAERMANAMEQARYEHRVATQEPKPWYAEPSDDDLPPFVMPRRFDPSDENEPPF